MERTRRVACPRCGAMNLFTPDNEWRPFCSERCKMIDLGLWGSDGYRIPDKQAGSEADADNKTGSQPD
ncbi:MAG TPA: DNA gyrase inhibitor YacG [Burkholderiales bacterium]|nr:DNA gyrase inhibitor YacG [Burkholderiales bacterium]